ncbi:hypothetical protein MJG53_017932 [Ovis ammon polii x Ovis aries]|uniref:Uncharacterized protein n=2 Tax=Ovis TaxID=9935 RepID=A0A835ZJM9_SHEEP|nr:hypothetical protein JEQ12_012289 [Ovis aries]KAI4559406.1 hypothetical protein MJG53_017932 [Ovis ammon polii x Ovis aries]
MTYTSFRKLIQLKPKSKKISTGRKPHDLAQLEMLQTPQHKLLPGRPRRGRSRSSEAFLRVCPVSSVLRRLNDRRGDVPTCGPALRIQQVLPHPHCLDEGQMGMWLPQDICPPQFLPFEIPASHLQWPESCRVVWLL